MQYYDLTMITDDALIHVIDSIEFNKNVNHSIAAHTFYAD